MSENEKKCPHCAEIINVDALKCKHCGEFLDGRTKEKVNVTVNNIDSRPKHSVGVAILLSFIFPGLGQMYKGNIGQGIIWAIVVTIGYIALLIPGIILHLICIGFAASKK